MIKKKNFNLLTKIIIGTAQFSKNYGVIKKKNQNPDEFIHLIRKYKIRTFDTSINYNKSFDLIEKNKKNSNLIIKLSTYKKNKIIPILKFKKQINQISSKIKENKIYSFMIHDFNLSYENKIRNHINFLSEYCLKKKIHFGFSIYNLREFNCIKKKYVFNILQIPLNIFNREFLDHKFIKYVKHKKIEVHARSVFLQGLLTNDLKFIPKKFLKFENLFSSWKKLCFKNGISRTDACINFILNYDFVSKIVIGFKNSEELKELIKIQRQRCNFIKNKTFSKIPKNLKNPNLWQKIKQK